MAHETPQDLEDLLDELSWVADRADDTVSVREVFHAIGERSFGPLLLAAGLLGMTPVSAIPGAPSTLALVTILIAGQLLSGRRTLWLPQRVLNLSVGADKLKATVTLARKPARIVDRLVKPRLTFLTGEIPARIVALVCILTALAVPPFEFLPFVAFVPATAIAAFGLGLVARDGLLLLVAFVTGAATMGLIARQVLL